MAGTIYRKPVLFAVVATVVILVGSIATMAWPALFVDMHPGAKVAKPLSALELAGRDVYQREGCMGCHTQMVRPLRSEVVRYRGNRATDPGAQYSIAAEFVYDHPFLWGSKRTGPDLAFEGWLKSAAWHRAHFENPQQVIPRSNMPAYAFLATAKLDAAELQAHMRALRALGVPYGDADLAAVPAAVQGKTEMDALVAYMLSLGKGVDRGGGAAGGVDLDEPNPMAGKPEAVARGHKLFSETGCSSCHGEEAEGQDGVAPCLVDDVFGGQPGDLPDAAYRAMIKNGSDAKKALGRPGVPDGGMQAFGGDLSDDDIWSIVAWLRSKKAHEQAEHK